MKSHPERKSLRLQGFDYSSNGAYFLTICTQDRVNYFGKIRNGMMGLNEMGLIAYRFFHDIPRHFEYAILDEFVIMPNHVHGIIFIDLPNPTLVGDRHACPLRPPRGWGKRNHEKLPVIIGSFKSAVSKKIHENHHCDFSWQRSYHDHIIRNEDELNRIRQYIRYNPQNWGQDKNNLF